MFELIFEVRKRAQPPPFVFANPAVGDFLNWDGVQVVQLLASAPDSRDQVGAFEQRQMFGDGLASHAMSDAEFVEGLTIAFEEPVEKFAAAGISEGLENQVDRHGQDYMQSNGCMSIAFTSARRVGTIAARNS